MLNNVSPAGFVLLVFEASIGCGGGRGRRSRRAAAAAAAAPAAPAAAVVIRPPGELLLPPPLPSCSSSSSAAADYFAAEDSLGSLDDADLEMSKIVAVSNKNCLVKISRKIMKNQGEKIERSILLVCQKKRAN